MTPVSDSFFSETTSFVKRHKTLCALTLGIAVVVYALGNLAGRGVSWICECYGTTKKVDTVAHKTLLSSNSGENRSTNELRTNYVIPKRRICNYGGMESLHTIERAKKAVFVTDEEIIRVHPIKFLSNSPYVGRESSPEGIVDEAILASIQAMRENQANAIAVTEDGKHVILQQAIKSCVPTCMAMLILDHGKIPDYKASRTTHLATTPMAIEWARKADLECRVTIIPRENVIRKLIECLEDKGPGMLSISHPTIGGHVIILDEISMENKQAVIRDSFHGWMITMKLEALESWLRAGGDFVQIL